MIEIELYIKMKLVFSQRSTVHRNFSSSSYPFLNVTLRVFKNDSCKKLWIVFCWKLQRTSIINKNRTSNDILNFQLLEKKVLRKLRNYVALIFSLKDWFHCSLFENKFEKSTAVLRINYNLSIYLNEKKENLTFLELVRFSFVEIWINS